MLPVDQTLLRPCGIRPLGNAGDFAGKRIELDKTLSIDLGQHRSLDLFPALLIFKLGLIDEVLAPASTNKRPVPEWQCHTAKAKSSASTPTDMHVNERTVGRSGGLFVWVAGMGSTKPLA